jgi:DNA-binding NarL/FixJ family response regulator
MIEAAAPRPPASSSQTSRVGGVDQNGADGPAKNRPRILCIEDDFETLALIAEELGDRGFDVITATNGQEGFSAIQSSQPDLVLCDINMPLMSGFEVLERLTATAPSFGNIPFVFLTALSDRDTELKGRNLGADDFVAKPIDFDLLHAIINARLTSVARMSVWPAQSNLNEREIESLTWAARGKSSDEIAGILGIGKRAVDFHIDNARAKLGVATRIQAAVGGLIKP